MILTLRLPFMRLEISDAKTARVRAREERRGYEALRAIVREGVAVVQSLRADLRDPHPDRNDSRPTAR